MIRAALNLVWPRIASEEALNPQKVFEGYHLSIEQIDVSRNQQTGSRLFELSKYIFDDEEQRRVRIEQKATASVSAITISSALVIALTPLLLGGRIKAFNAVTIPMVSFYLVAFVYLVRAVIMALAVFAPIIRYGLGPDDLVPTKDETSEQYLNRMSKKFIAYAIENYKVNNRQVAKVYVAQACFRNALVLLATSCLILVLVSISTGLADGNLQNTPPSSTTPSPPQNSNIAPSPH